MPNESSFFSLFFFFVGANELPQIPPIIKAPTI